MFVKQNFLQITERTDTISHHSGDAVQDVYTALPFERRDYVFELPWHISVCHGLPAILL